MVASVGSLGRSLKREWRFLLACARFLPTPGSYAKGGMTCAKRRFAFYGLTRFLIRSITALFGILTEDPIKNIRWGGIIDDVITIFDRYYTNDKYK